MSSATVNKKNVFCLIRPVRPDKRYRFPPSHKVHPPVFCDDFDPYRIEGFRQFRRLVVEDYGLRAGTYHILRRTCRGRFGPAWGRFRIMEDGRVTWPSKREGLFRIIRDNEQGRIRKPNRL